MIVVVVVIPAVVLLLVSSLLYIKYHQMIQMMVRSQNAQQALPLPSSLPIIITINHQPKKKNMDKAQKTATRTKMTRNRNMSKIRPLNNQTSRTGMMRHVVAVVRIAAAIISL